ncbi:gliding motility-associated protein GldE [uncultured Porphyromonas sp.]|uniref:gliding motility-associated protein GldE n=1 Tax=uncultured Porphyromonas sp. TaxID=159274 RepID=UPI0026281C38|nr:gliding motility-associated protein GldE [uncultured Porphyromonas sp.]
MEGIEYISSGLLKGVGVIPLGPEGIVTLVITLVLIAVCLYYSGFCSSSEVAYFALTPSQLEELKSSKEERDKKVIYLLEHGEYMLSTILISNNFVNTAIVMLSDSVVNQTLDFSHARTLGFILQVVVITFAILLVGEIIPKVSTQMDPLRVARRNVTTLFTFYGALKGINKALVRMGEVIGKSLTKNKSELDREDLSKAIELTTEDSEEQGVLNEILLFQRKTVSEVMTPRIDMAALELSTPYAEVLSFVEECGYSRIPVYYKRIDSIKGILYAKDLLQHLSEAPDFRWEGLLREVLYTPEDVKVSHMLEVFRKERRHMAIVVDEYGGTSGLVTMEDLLEEIVGDIEDEYDEDEQLYKELPDGSFVFDGKISILDFLRIVKVEDYDAILRVSDEAETLAGLLLEVKGDFPQVNEVITIDGHQFKVLSITNRRISKILFIPDPEKTQDDEVRKQETEERP